MNYKNTVLAGMVFSALFTTLVLFEWLPAMAAAGLVFIITLIATYYIALSQVRGARLGDQELLQTACRRLQEQEQEPLLIEQLIHWATSLVPCQNCFWIGERGSRFGVGDEKSQAWLPLHREIIDGGKVLNWPVGQKEAAIPDTEITSLLARPVYSQDKAHGVIYLVNRKGQPRFNSDDESALGCLAGQAAAALKGFEEQEKQKGYYLQLLTGLIRGREREMQGFEGHGERVNELAGLLGETLRLSQEEKEALNLASLLHDIGRRGNECVNESGDMWEQKADIEDHPRRGADYIPAEDDFIWIKEAILYHHERYNGSGYPEGLRHTEIPLLARIIAVADIYDALTRLGGEEQRLTPGDAFAEIKKATGTLLDPLVVVALEEVLPQLEEKAQGLDKA